MKAFATGIAVAVALATVAAISLEYFQKTVAQAYATNAERFDRSESVNFYGR